ncbi:MAG: glycosyltransferase [Marinilabiliaceae bacterium]|nr:glycosyltransferase [Marinilabiliaceae bacterium]
MKVLYIASLNVKTGGPSFSTYNTLIGLKAAGADVESVCSPLESGDRLIGDEIPVRFSRKQTNVGIFHYTPHLKEDVRRIENVDLYHIQGVWMYSTCVVASLGREIGKPYIISLRGTLYPQDIMKSNAPLKKLALKLRLLKDLNNAACIHTTCEEEMNYCRALGVKAPCCVVPNPIEIKEYQGEKEDAVFRLGYLGRLSPRKNVESLIYAFSELGEKARDAELLIIGGGDDSYEHFLKKEVERLGLNNVRFVGFLTDKEKDKALATCSVLAMPSEFENFGNVILEGLIRRIPCIATKGAPWRELETERCGWWCDYSQEAITSAIAQAMEKSANELHEMGSRGRELVVRRYSIESVAAEMLSVYRWVTGEGEKPECVVE